MALVRHPQLKVTLFVAAAWYETYPHPTRKLYASTYTSEQGLIMACKMKPASIGSFLGVFCSFVILLLSVAPAYAYLDAGTASLLLQSLLGGIAIAFAGVSVFWRRLVNFFLPSKNDEGDVENGEVRDHEVD